MLDILRNLSKASFDYVSFLGSVVGKLVMMGFPPWSGSLTEAPFDVLGDTLRGTKGIMLDMYRQPDLLKQACEKLVGIMAEYTMSSARANGNHPIVFIPLHKGTAATRDGKGGFMSLKSNRSLGARPFSLLATGASRTNRHVLDSCAAISLPTRRVPIS